MKKLAGYTLVELSLVLVVLGIVIVLIWRFVGFNADHALANSQRAMMRSADQAISGFVLSHKRLPCPDTDGDGLENCSGTAAVGRLPAISIGLSQADATRVRYGVYRNASTNPIIDADLAALGDRMPLLAVDPDTLTGIDDFQGNLNGIDLCAALRNAANSPASDSYLHVVTPEKHINVAYALALAGRRDADAAGGLLDDGNAAAGVAFEAPSRVTDGGYDDRVVAIGFDRLIGRLGCSEALAAVTHAHANAATMAEITRQAMADYKVQLDLINTLADANLAGAYAAVALAAAGVATGAAEAALGLSEALLSLGAAAEIEALAIAAVVAAGIAQVSALAALAPAHAAKDAADNNVKAFHDQAFVTRSDDLAKRIRKNANDADREGVYGQLGP